MSTTNKLMGLSRYYSRHAPASPGDFFIDELAATELVRRCADLKLTPGCMLDLGARAGACSRLLHGQYSQAKLVSLECSSALLACSRLGQTDTSLALACSTWPLPLADNSFELVVANLSPSFWPEDMVAECLRLLADDGALVISCFGRRTLLELHRLYERASLRIRQRPCPDVMQLGDKIQACGGIDPVIDCAEFHIEYNSSVDLRIDFRRAGISFRAETDLPADRIDSIEHSGIVSVEILTAVAFK